MQCYRVSDGKTVPESEAFGPDGIRNGYSVRQSFVRPGDYIGFDMAFLDAAPATAAMMTDAERSFADSAEGRAVIAHAKSVFDLGQACKPACQRAAWATDMASAAVRGRIAAQVAATSTPVADAETATRRVIEQAAYARSADFNAWRRG